MKKKDICKEEEVSSLISDICNKELNKVPSETAFNHTMVGNSQNKPDLPSLYNPHNYRLYFTFKKDNFKPWLGMVGVWSGKFQNHGKEFSSIGNGVRITVKKTKVEVINKLTEDQWFSINKATAKEEIAAVLNKIDDKCQNSLKQFIEVYGGSSDYVILKRENRALFDNLRTKSDNKVMKEKYIDTLPFKMTFETPIVKKVYKENNVEFKEGLYAAQYLENSALNDFAPGITEELKGIRSIISENIIKKDVEWLTNNINNREDGLKYKKDIEKLSEGERWQLAINLLKKRIFGDNFEI